MSVAFFCTGADTRPSCGMLTVRELPARASMSAVTVSWVPHKGLYLGADFPAGCLRCLALVFALVHIWFLFGCYVRVFTVRGNLFCRCIFPEGFHMLLQLSFISDWTFPTCQSFCLLERRFYPTTHSALLRRRLFIFQIK